MWQIFSSDVRSNLTSTSSSLHPVFSLETNCVQKCIFCFQHLFMIYIILFIIISFVNITFF